jgi:UDP-glucose 4-epimerase
LCSGIFPNLKKVIFASTVDVYKRVNTKINESSELEVNSLYVAYKLMSEHIVEDYCIRNDIEFDILRIGHIYGSGDDVYQKVLPNMIRAIKSGDIFRLIGNTKQSLNLMYVDDLVDLMAQLADSETSMGVLNIVSSTNVSIGELIQIMEEETNLKLNIEVIDDMKEKFQYNFSNEKLRKNLNLVETPIEEAIRKVLGTAL